MNADHAAASQSAQPTLFDMDPFRRLMTLNQSYSDVTYGYGLSVAYLSDYQTESYNDDVFPII